MPCGQLFCIDRLIYRPSFMWTIWPSIHSYDSHSCLFVPSVNRLAMALVVHGLLDLPIWSVSCHSSLIPTFTLCPGDALETACMLDVTCGSTWLVCQTRARVRCDFESLELVNPCSNYLWLLSGQIYTFTFSFSYV
jgi:hypothetical protein